MVGRVAAFIAIPFDIAAALMWLLEAPAGLAALVESGMSATAATMALPTRKPVSVTRIRRISPHLLPVRAG
jgi:hypothetical protein